MDYRKKYDVWGKSFTFLASSLTIVILVSIFSFIFIKGIGTLNPNMIFSDYWGDNYYVGFESEQGNIVVRPDNLPDDVYYSPRYGIGLKDTISSAKEKEVIITYIAPESVFANTISLTTDDNYHKPMEIKLDSKFEMLHYKENSQEKVAGSLNKQSSEEIISILNQENVVVDSLYYKTQGGGIWGSILATLMLIGISLCIALPIGIGSALYLTEIAEDTKLKVWMERSIELLAGIPSIIFGLMGVVVLFPITALLNIDGLSILLGGLTMGVVLLPVIIRSTQEALLIVPKDYRASSYSLGATKTQTIFKVILPAALPGILSTVLLAISRVVGESAALIYTMGTFINDSPSLNESATTLSVQIWSIMGQEQPNFELACAISLVILFLVLALNVTVNVTSNKLRRKMGI